MHAILTTALAASLISAAPEDGAIYIVTSTWAGDGALVEMSRSRPWKTRTLATFDSLDAAVQSFTGVIVLVETAADRVRLFDAAGTEIRSIGVGDGTAPRDILGIDRTRAYVTRAASTHLYRIDLQTGTGADVVDLSALADADGIPEMERMARDDTRLYVQLRRLHDGVPAMSGAIAVIDLETETLIDAIELTGPAPRLRMHVDRAAGELLVSATDGHHLSLGGGVERVDLGTMTTGGFVLAEAELAALGGFVMTSASGGYFVFHTDIVPSNHLQRFDLEHGAEFGPEVHFDWGEYLDALLYDDTSALLYMPAAVGGMHVIDTVTETPLTSDPVALPGFPVDQVIGPIGHPYDLSGDAAVGVADLLVLLGSWGPCPGPCPPTCLADIASAGGPGTDCAVDVADLLLLLAHWGESAP